MTVNRVAERISLLLAWLAGIMAVAMMFHISLDVFCKYFFNRPLDGTIEIVSLYYMVGIVFLPISYISLTDSHIVHGCVYSDFCSQHGTGSISSDNSTRDLGNG